MGLAVGVGGFINVPPATISGNGPPPSSFKGQLGQSYFDKSTSPATEYVYNGSTWVTAGANPATTTTYGTVLLTDNSEPVATKLYADNLAIAGAPVATETTAGIGELATNAEAVARTASTGALALFLTPTNLTPVLSSPGPIGDSTPSTGAFTDLSATGTISISSAAPITIDVTGAGNDLTLSSDAGRVIVNGEEAAANAVTIFSAAGGIDIDAALQINIASSQNAVDAIRMVASAGGIDIDAVGAATEDINITNTGGSVVIVATESAADSVVIQSTAGGIDILASGAAAGEDIDITATGSSVNITSTENNAGAIIVRANGGTSERVTLLASQGTGADSINLESTAGGITLSAALASADAINLAASAGGVDIDGALQINIASSQNAVDAIRIVASAGGIDIDAVGAATEDINITNTGGSVVIVATESAADSVVIQSTAGGIDILASGASAGEDIDITATGSSVNISSTENAANAITLTSNGGTSETIVVTNSQGTSASSIALTSTAGGLTFTAGLGTADAINLVTSNVGGGIDIDAGTAGFIVDTTGAISLDSAAASNFTVTGAFDLTLNSTAGSVIVQGAEAAVDAVTINASNAAGGIDINAGSGGITADTTAAISLDSATASNFTVTGAADLTLASTAGAVNVTSGEANADSINITSAGGMNVVATGAAAKDTIITNTNGSMTLTAGESVSDAFNLTASGAASGMTLTAGTLGITFVSGIKQKVTSVAAAASPYAVLGTDYFITTDTTAGVLTLTLPATPVIGRTLIVYDGVGQAAINAVTIDGNGKSIAAAGTSAGTKTLTTAYSSMTLTYNGTLWLGQKVT